MVYEHSQTNNVPTKSVRYNQLSLFNQGANFDDGKESEMVWDMK